jgi:hypothetical protein
MEEQNILIICFWRNPKQYNNMHVYRHFFGRMLLKQASISITGNQYVVIIGILLSNCGMAPNQTYLISKPLAVRRMSKDRRANKLAPKSEDMIFIGYEPGTKGYRFWSKIRRTVIISSTATFDEFDFPNCPREKIPDKLPPVNQSPNPSDDEESDPGGDDGHQPPDTFNQDDHQPGNNDSPGKPYAKPTKPWSGVQQLPSEDSDDSNDLYRPPSKRGPSKPTERTSTEVLRNTSSPAPNQSWVPRPDPVPRPRFPQTPCTEPSMGYGKNHPKAPMEPRIRPPQLIKPVIQKDSVYGNRTPIQIKQEIRSEQDFVRRILRQGHQDQPEPSTPQQRDPDTPSPENPDEEEPNTQAGKIVLSSTSFAELLSYAVETIDVPKFFRDIKKMPKEDQQGWIDACDNEIKSLAERKVWKLVDLPQNCRTIKCRWVLVRKADRCKKARLVAKGFTQVYGIDYKDTFAPVARFETVWILLALAALENWDIKALNVKIAYLYGSLDEEICMDQPEGYIKKGQERKVCQLLKSLYGLKQSALQWNKEIHKALMNLGFTRTHSDAGEYFKFKRADIIVIVIYVDDVLLMGSDKKMLKKNKEDVMKVFETRDLGEAKEYLGMRITRDRKKRTINLDQCAYAEKVLKRFGL